MHISAYAYTHIQAHSLMRALTLSCARTHARTRMQHTGARAQTRMHPGTRMHAHTHPRMNTHTCARTRTNTPAHANMRTRTHATHMHAVTCKHAPAQCTCMHTHAAHARMHLHNAHTCVCTRTREHACTCAHTRVNTRPHILAARYHLMSYSSAVSCA